MSNFFIFVTSTYWIVAHKGQCTRQKDTGTNFTQASEVPDCELLNGAVIHPLNPKNDITEGGGVAVQ